MTMKFELAREVIRNGTPSAFPAAVVEVGRHDRTLWTEACGVLSHELDALPATLDTVFDLASLTKVIATTTLAMTAVDERSLTLTDLVDTWLPEWVGADRLTVTVEDLLAHDSGLTAHVPFFRDHSERAEFEHAICRLPLEYLPRSRSLYSDLGFILLGFILEDAVGAPLDAQFDCLVKRHRWGAIGFRPGKDARRLAAPTEIDPWRGRLLIGEVDDQNTWALGGVAGHAGLFGTADAVGRFAKNVLQQYHAGKPLARSETFKRFTAHRTTRNSSRALGWDTMRPTSSCGTRMSEAAIGHTGFTGTSIWIDPMADIYAVLLTNRVCPSSENNAILELRPLFHDAIMAALG